MGYSKNATFLVKIAAYGMLLSCSIDFISIGHFQPMQAANRDFTWCSIPKERHQHGLEVVNYGL